MPIIKETFEEVSKEDIEREGLVPVNCLYCGACMAHQTRDGHRLILNGQTSSYNRVKISCKCGKGFTWRPSRGSKSRSALDNF